MNPFAFIKGQLETMNVDKKTYNNEKHGFVEQVYFSHFRNYWTGQEFENNMVVELRTFLTFEKGKEKRTLKGNKRK